MEKDSGEWEGKSRMEIMECCVHRGGRWRRLATGYWGLMCHFARGGKVKVTVCLLKLWSFFISQKGSRLLIVVFSLEIYYCEMRMYRVRNWDEARCGAQEENMLWPQPGPFIRQLSRLPERFLRTQSKRAQKGSWHRDNWKTPGVTREMCWEVTSDKFTLPNHIWAYIVRTWQRKQILVL